MQFKFHAQNYLHKIIFPLLVPLLILVLLAVFSQPYKVYDYYFNPDSLYLTTLYQSLFVDGHPLISNYLNPSLLLIPDALLFFLFRFATGDTIISSFLFSIIQNMLIFIGILMIFKAINVKSPKISASFSALLFMLFFLGPVFSGDIIFAAFSLVSTNHVGAFVMTLFSIALVLNHLSKPSSPKIIGLGAIVFFSTISDRLFIVMFIVPVVLISTYQLFLVKEKKYVMILAALVSTLALSIIVHSYIDGRFVNIQKLPGVFQFEKIVPAFRLMMEDLGNYLFTGDTHTFIILLSLVSLLLHLFLSVKLLADKKPLTLTGFYILFSTTFILIIFWMPVATGTYVAKHILRYNISAFYLAILNLPFILNFVFEKTKIPASFPRRITEMALIISFLTMFSIASLNMSRKGIADFFDYYPDFVRELDEIAQKENLLNGVAHFWNAKPITVFSKQGLKVFHTFDPFVPYYHVTSKMYYVGNDQIFNFALISNFDNKTAYRKYLDHEGRLVKNGQTEVLILPPFKFDKYTGLPYFIESPQEK